MLCFFIDLFIDKKPLLIALGFLIKRSSSNDYMVKKFLYVKYIEIKSLSNARFINEINLGLT